MILSLLMYIVSGFALYVSGEVSRVSLEGDI